MEPEAALARIPMMRRRLALTLGLICAALAFGAFFYFGQNREVESRARSIASDKAIWATAAERGSTYAVVRSSTSACYPRGPITSAPVTEDALTLATIDRQQCEYRMLYGDNYDQIWERQRMIEWLELPMDIALAFVAGFAVVYLLAGAMYLIRDRWWPWVRGA